MHQFLQKLIGNAVILTDGAWGTELQRRGLKPGENPDSWNLTHPATVEEVPKDYIDAGSKIVLTNTFGANRYTLKKMGLEDKVEEINVAGVEISKKAVGDHGHVFASIGPTGELLVGKTGFEEELEEVFSEQAQALKKGGADAIVVETMMDLHEATAAINAAKKTGLPVIACAVFGAGKSKDRTMMGSTVEDVVEAFVSAGADGIGSNCGQEVTAFIPICERMRALTDLPLWMKPNAGLPSVENGATTYKTGPEQFADGALKLVEAGADFIGGCCGTNPDYIRALSQRIEPYKKDK